MQPSAVSSHHSAADRDAEDDKDINCETSSLLALATHGKRQQELLSVVKLASGRGRCRRRSASARERHGSATRGPGCRAGPDGGCAKAGDGHHPARQSSPAEHRPNLAEARCELLPRLPPAAAHAAGQGPRRWLEKVPSTGCCHTELGK